MGSCEPNADMYIVSKASKRVIVTACTNIMYNKRIEQNKHHNAYTYLSFYFQEHPNEAGEVVCHLDHVVPEDAFTHLVMRVATEIFRCVVQKRFLKGGHVTTSAGKRHQPTWWRQ